MVSMRGEHKVLSFRAIRSGAARDEFFVSDIFLGCIETEAE